MKKSFRTIRAIILSLLMLGILLSCGGGGDDGGSNDTPIPIDGDDTGRVLGRVRNAQTSEFISEAVVTVAGLSDTTDVVGTFWFEKVPEGNQTLGATAEGYANYSSSITVVADQDNSYVIEMEPLYTISVPITKDTYVDQHSPFSAYGDSNLIIITDAENVRKDALLYAPISNFIPEGSEITKVEFVGYCAADDPIWDFSIAPLLGPWDELSVTWDTRPSQWFGLSADNVSKIGTQYRIDMRYPYTDSTYAPYAIKYGISIIASYNDNFPDWNGIWFCSSEHSTPSYHPWFEVTYIK